MRDVIINEMNNGSEIIHEVKKAMEFYRELGFEYLPVKKEALPEVRPRVGVQLLRDGTGTGADLSNEAALRGLREEIGECRRCKICKGRKNIVFGEGDPDAGLMFVGEGPGRDEDIQARPFVGDAGKLLTNMIVKLGMKREDVYIANIVKCRPPYNRNPERDEISECRPFLETQIDIIRPKVIVCLGKVSANVVLEVETAISRLRGNFFAYNDIPVMPTFHPAYLLRNPKEKWLTWEDMQKVMEKLK